MPVAKTIARQLENASWIRRMFEEGVRLKRERGADAIFDYSLGNPDVEPPPGVLDALRRVVAMANDLHPGHATTSSTASPMARYTDLSSSFVVQ